MQECKRDQPRLDNLALVSTFPDDYLPYAYRKRKSELPLSNSHWKYKRKHWWMKRKCCNISSVTTVVAIVLTVVAFMTALGISVYFGILTTFYTSPVFHLFGQMRVVDGDIFNISLLNENSENFATKASIYENKLRSTYLRSLFQNVLHDVKVYAFRKPGLTMFFRLHLDRRKTSELQSVSHLAKTILAQEIQNGEIFRGLTVNPNSIIFSEVSCVDDCPIHTSTEMPDSTQPFLFSDWSNSFEITSTEPTVINETVSPIIFELPQTIITEPPQVSLSTELIQNISNVQSAKNDSSEAAVGLAKVVSSHIPSNNIHNGIQQNNIEKESKEEIKNDVGLLNQYNVTSAIPHLQTVDVINKDVSNTLSECAEGKFHCANEECIPAESRCDQQLDCTDHSDEKNCSCADYLNFLQQSHKICDGIVDCWDYSDEKHCPWCSGEYICDNSKQCINSSQVCDGIQNCPTGSDESSCIKLSKDNRTVRHYTYNEEGYLMIQRQGQWKKLCIENTEAINKGKLNLERLGQTICTVLTYRSLQSVVWSPIEFKDNSYFDLTPPTKKSSVLFRPSECKDGKIVRIKCGDLSCGLRSPGDILTKRIVGGTSVKRNTWPWQVAMYREGQFQCGAILISDRWLLTAGHCFYHTRTSHWTARMGLLRRGSEIPTPYEEVRRVTHVSIHPQYVDKGFINDIAVLKLESAVPFSDHIRPICLPGPEDDISLWQGKSCSVIGWGKLMEIGHTFPDTLQEVQLPVISTEECRKRTVFLPIYQITDNMFCAGYEQGGRDACLGDSGGPLMCQKEGGRWTLMGITSNGDGCARAGRPGVYTKVSNYIAWIKSVLDGGESEEINTRCSTIRCRLGKCLSPDVVCDGILDCWNGADENNC